MYKIDHPFFPEYVYEPACDELLQPRRWPLHRGCLVRCTREVWAKFTPFRLQRLGPAQRKVFQTQQAMRTLPKAQKCRALTACWIPSENSRYSQSQADSRQLGRVSRPEENLIFSARRELCATNKGCILPGLWVRFIRELLEV